MTLFDDAIAQAVAEYRASGGQVAELRRFLETEKEVVRTLGEANTRIASERDEARAELAECLNPPPPRVPLGLYSGDLAEFKARKQMLGLPVPLTWAFPDMDDKISVAWDGEVDTLICNVHSVLRPSRQIPWVDVANTTTYDAGLIGLFKSLAALVNTRVILSIQEEHDGKDRLHHGPGNSLGTPEQYRAFFLTLKDYVNEHAPNVECWQVVADVDRLKDWFIPEADGYACDPHFYGWSGLGVPQGGWFAERLDHAAVEFARLAPTKPFALHVGGYENPNNPDGKAMYVEGMGNTLKTAKKKYPRLDHVTYWDRGAEAIDTSPATLAAFKEILA